MTDHREGGDIMKRTFALSVILGLIIILGCGTSDDITPSIVSDVLVGDISDIGTTSIPTRSIEKWIVANKGGKLTYEGATLEIPAGALNEDTLIKMDVTETERAINFLFAPHPLSFNIPVKLKLTAQYVKEIVGDESIVYYYDEAQRGLIGKTTGYQDSPRAFVVFINHFSQYYFARP